MSPTDGSYNSPTEGAEATVSTGSLAVGRHILFVRGRGTNDYEGYRSWGPITAAFLDVLAGTPTPATSTPVPSTPTSTAIPVTATNTTVPGTPTNTPATATSTPTVVASPCAITFSDVQATDYFYEAVKWLYCRGAISGYSDGTFRPYNNTTRGQLTKIVVLAEGWPIDLTGAPHFTDVDSSNPFYNYIETAVNRGIISGYEDRTFTWGNNVNRGQLAKIIVLAEDWPLANPQVPTFTDVPPDHPFYRHIETAFRHNAITGYDNGTFRPANNATRGQISAIVHRALTGP
ncbi:MAG: S-layer homology domain-containing protein [Chloroflexia bacterium]